MFLAYIQWQCKMFLLYQVTKKYLQVTSQTRDIKFKIRLPTTTHKCNMLSMYI